MCASEMDQRDRIERYLSKFQILFFLYLPTCREVEGVQTLVNDLVEVEALTCLGVEG